MGRVIPRADAWETLQSSRDLSDGLVTLLEASYPSRCMEAGESVGDHLRYAGAVALIAVLRDLVEARKQSTKE